MVNCGMTFIKYLLFLFNFLFVVIGAILIGIGVSSKVGWNNKYLSFIQTGELSTPPNLFIAVGVFIFIIAFLGCCGAYRENHCMILTYSVLVGLILVLELAGAFAAFALKDDVKMLMQNGLTTTQQQYRLDGTNKELTQSWNMMQQHLHCCGIHYYTDWQGKINGTTSDGAAIPANYIPESCCFEDIGNCTKSITTDTPWITANQTIYTEGCLDKAVADIAVGGLGVAGLVLAAIELLGVICACFLARSIRYSYETV